jgi:protein-L-isoaspartate(D-aspartate) O-methyltransferase
VIIDEMSLQRQRMVQRLRDHYKITDERILAVMSAIPRHRFVPEALRSQAYNDNALPISAGQTISQPFIVARMTELLELSGPERVLEIGSGSGYQTAVLTSLVDKVYAVERLPHLVAEAKQRLLDLGRTNFEMRAGDGTNGWAEMAPFDAILVAAGGPEIPKPLVDQLTIGGRLVIPVGDSRSTQSLVLVTRTVAGARVEDQGPCSFVPLIGDHGWDG